MIQQLMDFMRSQGVRIWVEGEHLYIQGREGRLARLTQEDAAEFAINVVKAVETTPNGQPVVVSLDKWTINH